MKLKYLWKYTSGGGVTTKHLFSLTQTEVSLCGRKVDRCGKNGIGVRWLINRKKLATLKRCRSCVKFMR